MVKAIKVKESNGQYQIPPNAEPELWSVILAEHEEEPEFVEDLQGWGDWTQAWRILCYSPADDWTWYEYYFVDSLYR